MDDLTAIQPNAPTGHRPPGKLRLGISGQKRAHVKPPEPTNRPTYEPPCYEPPCYEPPEAPEAIAKVTAVVAPALVPAVTRPGLTAWWTTQPPTTRPVLPPLPWPWFDERGR